MATKYIFLGNKNQYEPDNDLAELQIGEECNEEQFNQALFNVWVYYAADTAFCSECEEDPYTMSIDKWNSLSVEDKAEILGIDYKTVTI